ncbi:MAG: hypothetical protein PHS14_02930 [Elusimicrobia bacterium]|nr:hypothetical protein [Elusimicrobiota bacterium]
MMTKFLIAAALALAAIPARAQLTGCQYTTGPVQLQKIRSTAVGSQISGCVNASLDTLSASSVAVTGSTAAPSFFGKIYVNEIGGRSVGDAGIKVSSYVWVASSAAVTGGGGLLVTYGTDLGSATIRGQETVVGTMTVKGNAFSVGGSSFTVAGGSATVAYTITAGYFNGDGSGLTNLPTAGIGLASTQTWSGANRFTSSVTAGPIVYVATAVTSGLPSSTNSVFVNTWMVVASTNPSAASAVYFYGLQNNRNYRVRYFYTQNGSNGDISVTFNSIGGTVYVYSNACWASNASGDNATSAGGASWKQNGGSAEFAGERASGEFNFFNNGTGLSGQSRGTFSLTGSHVMDSCTGALDMTSAFTLADMKISISAGTITGWFWLEQLITGLPN